ncbi:PDZ domain-containing protein [Mariniblastus fucicola]|uniref:Serine endoprotease n=1 Tax=Mariniblastus fucicola TaxID=980251 RepID=A0A5B9PAU7_9BACT|nr:PDZ domain-containing protein [Mariniblastus fucicola]QEG20233.1 serine endoprotease [Mariniblastus fucicola]
MKTCILPLFMVVLCCSSAFAQEIILLNQDGEKVGIAKDLEEKGTVVGKAIRIDADGDAEKGSATIENGVITVVKPDGSVEEFKMSDAKSVTITRSSKTVVGEDGQQKLESTGKAILVGPDGVRREIDLGSGGLGGVVSESKGPKTWMIGVSCQPVSAVLRSQLKIDEETGLVITRVLRGGAAEQAGFAKNDIVMYADQKPVMTQKDLSTIVNEAGAEGLDVVFTVLRGGEEISLTVTPTEREGVNQMMVELGPDFGQNFPGFGPGMNFEFKQFGPGIILGEGGDFADGFGGGIRLEMMDEFNEKIRRMEERMEEMRRGMRGEDRGDF